MVVSICHKHIAGGIHGKSLRRVQLCLYRGAAITAEATDARAGNGCNDSVTADFPDTIIPGVGNEDIARSIDNNAVRIKELRLRGWSVISKIEISRRN